MRRLASLGCLAVTIVVAGCGGGAGAPEADGPLRVVATTGIVADVVRAVAGGRATVESLMGPGIDPHLYKASESDVRRLAEADVVFSNGLHLEGKMADVLVKMARTRRVVPVTAAIPEVELREPPEYEGLFDPHVWFDVGMWSTTVDVVVDALCEADPEGCDLYRANGSAHREELEALDRWVERRIAELPQERRILVTAHDAFGYFGRRYGVEVVGLQGISTLSEAGLQDVERVVELVVERDVPAIFVEASVPRRSIEAVRAAVRDRGAEVEIGGELYSDSMGTPGTEEGTYVGAVRANVNAFVGAMSGGATPSAPGGTG